MKKIILLLILFISVVSSAQQTETVSIDWVDGSGLFSETTSVKIPIFRSADFYYDYNSNAVFFRRKFPVNAFADENSLKISNIIYETIPQSKLGELSIAAIPTSIQASLKNMNNRENLRASISLSPIIKTSNGFQRIKSFTYSYASGTQRNENATFDFNTVSNSVLSTGEWYRFYVEKSGVYRISKSFLQSLGMNVDAADARNIKIYGNGGRMLPLLNSEFYPSDITENAIIVTGESDGNFGNDDAILFYAEGVDNWNEESQTHSNLYADRSYYYVTAQGSAGKRIANMPAISGNPTITTTTFDDYQYHELDERNIVRLGRRWFGEQFNMEDRQTFDFKFPNIAATSQIEINVAAAAASFVQTTMSVEANTQNLGNLTFGAISSTGSTQATPGILSKTFAAEKDIAIKVSYNNNGVPNANAYLDYIVLKAKSNLVGFGRQFRFQYNQAASSTGIIQYQFSNANGISQIWDVTDIYNVSKIDNTAGAQFSFKANLGEIRKYVAVDPSNYFAPSKESQSRVANQNLKGTIFKNNAGAFQDIDYLIVTPASLSSQAQRLADFHRTYSNLNVKVVNLENIYQEFSSGKQDIGAIRNFVKYVYNNASIPSKRIKYLNLFGDASFDYKNRIPNNTNVVPIYQDLSSFSLGGSYMTDDYFVMFDPTEGRMSGNSQDDMEVAVGRMLISDSNQAAQMINKVIEYHGIESYGKWRNNFVLISDDVDEEWEAQLQEGIDNLGDNISLKKPFVNVKKIHLDSYVQQASSGGQRYPVARTDLVNAIEQGALVFNYFGHGGEDGLAKERVYEKSYAQNLTNRYKYPLFVTVTCEFTRFDNPYRPTVGEYTYWNPTGGAVSLVTTTRQIDALRGKEINDAFSGELYGLETNNYVPVAEALRIAKNNYSSSVLMVSYIGDPALKIAIPKPTIVLTKINDEPAATSPFVFNALRPVKLSGEVRDLNGNTMISNYNGDLSVNIFDKKVQRSTLGNDGIRDTVGNLITMDFTLLGETIFRGNASVKNGLFEFSFVVPRDITIPIGNGRISFYAKRTQGLEDQTGYNTDIKVGGINESAVADNVGPRARLYMNDETFISGGITNESPFLLAFLEDENGINTASGIGHDIIAILDGNENNPYILNDYYETELDDYTKGKVRFPFRDLTVGLHTLTFRAWDVYNNPIETEIQFIVVGDETMTLTHVLNYPNPFVSYTQFWFTHNRPYEPLEVQVQILTVTGKIVKTINQIVNTEGFLSREITWDGKDDFGDKIGKGVYVYKLTVKSSLTNKKTEKFEKLVIL